jgi:hypothetical protein
VPAAHDEDENSEHSDDNQRQHDSADQHSGREFGTRLSMIIAHRPSSFAMNGNLQALRRPIQDPRRGTAARRRPSCDDAQSR